jgi:hypothetical protein
MRKLLLIAVAALLLAGCGDKESDVKFAETEGVTVTVAGLDYQVQLSRFLNPGSIDDDEYLMGLPGGATLPGGDEIWFGVWMRVKNYSGGTLTPTSTFTIKDTEGNEYHPVPLPATNVFRYAPQPLLQSQVLPVPNSAAASGPIQGSLILFRLKSDSLQNRPLELEIEQSGDQPATVDLDL